MKYLPYGRQEIDESDIAAVVSALQSDWLTTGPAVEQFERAVCLHTGARYAVAVSSGTAALHAIMHAIGIKNGDEVITTPLTFAATANAVLYCGGTPVFADIELESLLIDPRRVAEKITKRTRAIAAVDYAGQPCDYDELRSIADANNLPLISDACHSLGAHYRGKKVGTLADLNAFSFHPVKNITTAEGGMITTDSDIFADRLRAFRNHGITTDHRQRAGAGTYRYEMVDLGFNYRLSDLHCALGSSQIKRLSPWLTRRRAIAAQYTELLRSVPRVRQLKQHTDRDNAYHLYVVCIEGDNTGALRDAVFSRLRADGIGCNVHYLPVYLHPYYKDALGYVPGQCPNAELAYSEILSLPMFPHMSGDDVARVVGSLKAAVGG